MKNIKSFESAKYNSFEMMCPGIFKNKGRFVTALSFEQEPEFNEGRNADHISQYPLEDILDKYSVYVSDFFEDLNTKDSNVCYIEFSGLSLEAVQSLRGIIGKHVYNRTVRKNNKDYIELIIE